ncbi:MAG TPA: hypothetical protein VEL11_15275 [Candidatus Bathyarchaeia archaeon]|nr:hypothetical protein [Candidatus Bathyarchaeia archaeon]
MHNTSGIGLGAIAKFKAHKENPTLNTTLGRQAPLCSMLDAYSIIEESPQAIAHG